MNCLIHSHDEGHGSYHEASGHKKGGKKKEGHHKSGKHHDHFSKKGSHKKGSHHHDDTGHKHEGGHEVNSTCVLSSDSLIRFRLAGALWTQGRTW